MAAVKTALDAVAKARVGCDTSMGKGNGTGQFKDPITYIYIYINIYIYTILCHLPIMVG